MKSSSVLENISRMSSFSLANCHNVDSISADCLLSLRASTRIYDFANAFRTFPRRLEISPRLNGLGLARVLAASSLYRASMSAHNVESMLHN